MKKTRCLMGRMAIEVDFIWKNVMGSSLLPIPSVLK